MGWDAFAEPVERLWKWKHGRDGIADSVQEREFAAASDRVVQRCGTVDGFLSQGGLDVSNCERALHEATGGNTYPDGGAKYAHGCDWSPDDVKRYSQWATASWDSLLDYHEPWAVWSAREFLETCARLGLGVRFSW